MEKGIDILIERMDFMSYMDFCLSIQVAYMSMHF